MAARIRLLVREKVFSLRVDKNVFFVKFSFRICNLRFGLPRRVAFWHPESVYFVFLWPVAIAVQRTAFTYLGRAHERRSASKCMAGTQLVDPPRPCT